MLSAEKDDILGIRLNQLHEDAATQPRTLRQWCDKLAGAERKAKLAKRKLRVVKAELSRVVRQNPHKYSIFKVTDTCVEDAVVCISDYKTAETELIDAEYNRDMLKNMVSSLHERGEQIGNEVKLHGQQYWARKTVEPSTQDAEDFRTEAMQEIVGAITKTKRSRE